MTNIEKSGLDVVLVIALLTLLIGVVIVLLGATVLANFGVTIYTVNLMVSSFLREFVVLLTAILTAGCTAGTFTTQIGSMKANEEVDAIRALGLNPIELLVLLWVLTLLMSLPMSTFVGMLCGIVDGMTVRAQTLGIPPTMPLSIIEGGIDIQHFLVGASKAPLFAFLIAVVGCLEGFRVSDSTQSVGEHTTTSMVHSIFVVILPDTLVALFFMEVG